MTGIEAAGVDWVDGEASGQDDEIALAARSNARAFEALYERHHLAVFRYLRARMESDDDATELTAVTFERALKSIGRYSPRSGGLLPWLFTIARNAANDIDRRRRLARMLFGPERPEREPPDPVLAEDGILERERLSQLRRLVAGLPAVQREAIVLRFAGGLTAREIGVTLGKSEAAAQKILSRALATLREAYRDDA